MAFESQHKAARVLVISPNYQAAYGTALADGVLTYRPRTPGEAFINFGPNYQTDEGWYNKGHDFPSSRVRTENNSAFQMACPVDSYMAAWLIAQLLQGYSVTGAGPYTHVFKPLNSTRQARGTTLYVEDTAAIKTKWLDMVGVELTISGSGSGVLQASLSMVGSGKFTDGAMGGGPPAAPTPTMLLASDTDILIGPAAGAVSIKQYIRQWSYKITRQVEIFRSPGNTLFAVQANVEKLRASFSFVARAKDTEVAGDLRTIALADTVREVQFVTNSGASAQLTAKFPACYIRQQPSLDGNFVSWNVDASEEDCQKSGANEVIEVTAINAQATYLTGS